MSESSDAARLLSEMSSLGLIDIHWQKVDSFLSDVNGGDGHAVLASDELKIVAKVMQEERKVCIWVKLILV